MQEIVAWGAIIGALAAGTVSPGPSFIMVAREAVSASRSHGLWAALGMGVGGAAFAAAALAGLQTAFLVAPWLYTLLKLLGGSYLCYLGCRIWMSARQPLVAVETETPPGPGSARPVGRSFWSGLVTQLSNPKTAIVYASVFAALLPRAYSGTFGVTLVGSIFLLEAGWYALVAAVLSAEVLRLRYLEFKSWIDRVAGGIMGLLGLRLILSAHR